ncbi:uncharacterized protein LOC109005348 [Juglans regia]|uniref:Uncharacterized protein LOC109005348 n=1 Tax=Juglans regia TaxID=51240 RepID=A0A6P9EBY4_JUGRE|nr:uncharacterized protein LOC109005348 [Juglans regia]
MVAWNLWERRNEHVFGADLAHPSTLVAQVKKNLEDFKVATYKSTTSTTITPKPLIQWFAPSRVNRSQLLDPEQQIKKGVGGREDNISGEIKGKDGTSITTYNPIHPPEDQQRKGTSVLRGDNIGREARDRDPVPTTTKMSSNSTPIHAASSPFDLDQQQKPKGADDLRQEEDHKRNDSSKEQQINKFLGRENSTDKNDDANSNSLQYSSDTNIPVGIPIAENGDKGQQQISTQHVHVSVSVGSDNVTTTITVNGKQSESVASEIPRTATKPQKDCVEKFAVLVDVVQLLQETNDDQ